MTKTCVNNGPIHRMKVLSKRLFKYANMRLFNGKGKGPLGAYGSAVMTSAFVFANGRESQ